MKTTKCGACGGEGKVRLFTAAELRAARLAACLTQGELAGRMGRGGVSSAYVSDVERGKAGFSARQAGRWLAACARKEARK